VQAEATATKVTTEAQANTTISALNIEKDMCRNVKSNLGGKSNDFFLNFAWIRLLERKITDGVQTSITMDLPKFNQ
jgi:hypothetical protein